MKLIQNESNIRFPPTIRGIPYDPDFIIRGLFYDPKRSVMMKLDSYSVIDANAVFRGLEDGFYSFLITILLLAGVLHLHVAA